MKEEGNQMKRYIVTVTEVGQEKKTVGGQWEKGAGKEGDRYGITPEWEATRDYEREVFRQEFSDLDLGKFVTTING